MQRERGAKKAIEPSFKEGQSQTQESGYGTQTQEMAGEGPSQTQEAGFGTQAQEMAEFPTANPTSTLKSIPFASANLSQNTNTRECKFKEREGCSVAFDRFIEWERHERRTHWPQRKYICLICLAPHDSARGVYTCKTCPETFQTQSEAQRHVMKCVEAHSTWQECKHNQWKAYHDLLAHLRTKHANENLGTSISKKRGLWGCHICWVQLRTEDDLKLNVQLSHDSRYPEVAVSKETMTSNRNRSIDDEFDTEITRDWQFPIDSKWPMHCIYPKSCQMPGVQFSTWNERAKHNKGHHWRPESGIAEITPGRAPREEEDGDEDPRPPAKRSRHSKPQIGKSKSKSRTNQQDVEMNQSQGVGQQQSRSQDENEVQDLEPYDSGSQQETLPSPNHATGWFSEELDGQCSRRLLHLMPLGTGATSTVDEVYDAKYPEQILARRTIPRRPSWQFLRAEYEVKILLRLNHRHIAALIDWTQNEIGLQLIMAPVAEQNLMVFMNNISQNGWSKSKQDSTVAAQMIAWVSCLSSALAYIHGQGVVHGDIKPENIVIKGTHICFTDFGAADLEISPEAGTQARQFSMTPLYCAPEVWNRTSREQTSDVWSFGCVILEVCTIIAGKSMEDLRAHRGSARYKPYHVEFKNTMQWIGFLRWMYEYMWTVDGSEDYKQQTLDAVSLLDIMRTTLFLTPECRATSRQIHDALPMRGCCCADADDRQAPQCHHGIALQDSRAYQEAIQTTEAKVVKAMRTPPSKLANGDYFNLAEFDSFFEGRNDSAYE